MTDWKKVQESFEAIPEGELLMDENQNYWIKPVQSISHHLDEMLVSLSNGSLAHFSRFEKLTPVYGSEIRW